MIIFNGDTVLLNGDFPIAALRRPIGATRRPITNILILINLQMFTAQGAQMP
jgi:hypothetical protein